MMLVSDGGTSMKFPMYLKTKTGQAVTDSFALFHVKAENQTGEKIKCVRFDLGREFDNQIFLGYCAKFGIRVDKVPKDSSSANGHVEQGNHTVIAGARTQMIESGLPHAFWAESCTAYCYMLGFMPSTRHPGKVPLEVWYKKGKLNVSHIRVCVRITCDE